MARDAAKLARLHCVRTVQLNLVRADEARAHDRWSGERTLVSRIAVLAEAIAPAPDQAAGLLLGGAAHFRDRLHQSQAAAAARLDAAAQAVARAAAATRAARRDQHAVEQLMVRADAEAARAARKVLEAAPALAGKRHDPC